KIGRCSAEHVGQDRDTVAAIDALDRLDDVLAALLAIVIRTDGDRFDLVLRADHVLQGSAELNGEPPMGDDYQADHRNSPRARYRLRRPKGPHPCPPPPPSAGGPGAYLTTMLHCGNPPSKEARERGESGQAEPAAVRLTSPFYRRWSGISRGAGS